jgi:hypothetical protein
MNVEMRIRRTESHSTGMFIRVTKEFLDRHRKEAERDGIATVTDCIIEVDGVARALTYEELLAFVTADKPQL